jgi:FkbM family methyltransferase
MNEHLATAASGGRRWVPPWSLEERLKSFLVPPRLGLRWALAREMRRGEREIRLVPRLADPRRVSLDVGANRGVWTEALRRHSRAVVAFEPNPKMFDDLRRRIGPGVTALPYALSDRSGTGELRIPRRRKGFSNQGGTLSHGSLGDCAFGAVAVEMRRLDELDPGDVGLIKIDVEGHELAVLRGAAGLLARCRPVLIVEMEEKHLGRPIAGALAEVAALGYEPCALRDGAPVPVAGLDLARLHGPGVAPQDYVFNWIFLPR